MEYNEIRNALYNKYIVPTKGNNNDFIGVEIEIPILNLNKESVDFEKVHEVAQSFIDEFRFTVLGTDDDGNVYSAQSKTNGDILSFDCSYNNLELSFGKAVTVFDIWERFKKYYNYLQEKFCEHNYTLTGMGINPYRNYNKNIPIPNGRYRMLFRHLSSYRKYYGDTQMYFHRKPSFGMFSSASQVQLDVNCDNLSDTVNAFSALEPIKALLFSNSVLLDESDEITCYRDIFWENSTQGLNPHNVGMYNTEFESVSDILSYIETTSIYCVEREDKYINFKPISIVDFMMSEKIEGEYYKDGNYHKIVFSPRIEDLDYLRTYKFEDLTYRGTIEYRSVCCQPIKDSMVVAAFHLGIKRKINEVNALLSNDTVIYHHAYSAYELRRIFIHRNLPKFVNQDNLYDLVIKVLDLAKEGLIERNYGEEVFLEALYDRAKRHSNPAKDMLNHIENGGSIEDIIKNYSDL